jgi:hypothetical protein
VLQALRGGGLCIEAPERVRVSDTTLTGNTAEVDGGAVLIVSVHNGTAEFLRSPITNNTVRDRVRSGGSTVTAGELTLCGAAWLCAVKYAHASFYTCTCAYHMFMAMACLHQCVLRRLPGTKHYVHDVSG